MSFKSIMQGASAKSELNFFVSAEFRCLMFIQYSRLFEGSRFYSSVFLRNGCGCCLYYCVWGGTCGMILSYVWWCIVCRGALWWLWVP